MAKNDKTRTIRQQKFVKFVLHTQFFLLKNTAKLLPKGDNTLAIRQQMFVLHYQIFFLHTKIFVQHTKKIIICTTKNSICTAKIAISTFSRTLDILLSFWHTFSYFPILSQLLAHCADLSKSEGQLCCCHKTCLRPVLFLSVLNGKMT